MNQQWFLIIPTEFQFVLVLTDCKIGGRVEILAIKCALASLIGRASMRLLKKACLCVSKQVFQWI
ncbi:MAG: hypothetical protein DWI24_12025 [Planctomycetota bacterium]|nr:MAG: hypothetical protein DWI24_12025 [Planctomycetota bacterium]